jgi:hypothetical protein
MGPVPFGKQSLSATSADGTTQTNGFVERESVFRGYSRRDSVTVMRAEGLGGGIATCLVAR